MPQVSGADFDIAACGPNAAVVQRLDVEKGDTGTWWIELSTGESRRVSGGRFPGCTSDGKLLRYVVAAAVGHFKLMELALDGGTAREIANVQSTSLPEVRVSPDNQLIAYKAETQSGPVVDYRFVVKRLDDGALVKEITATSWIVLAEMDS